MKINDNIVSSATGFIMFIMLLCPVGQYNGKKLYLVCDPISRIVLFGSAGILKKTSMLTIYHGPDARIRE